MSGPIFFQVYRTRCQVRIEAVEYFKPDGSYMPLGKRHPQAAEAAHILDALTVAARGLPEPMITCANLVPRTERYLMPDEFARLSAIPANANVPARIVLKGAN